MESNTTLNTLEKKEFFLYNVASGIKAGVPIAVGYIPIAIAFGLLAKSLGIPNIISVLMSIIVFAGASQFVGVKLIALGAAPLEIIMTTFILNFRHFLMSSSLSQRIESGTSKKLLNILTFGITDETFSVASLQEEAKLNPYFLLGLNFSAYLSWVLGTCIGVFLAGGLPGTIKSSMGIALYAMFIGLLVPAFKGSKNIFLVSMAAVFINSLLYWSPLFKFLSTGWSIIISTMLAAGMGSYFFPQGGKKDE